MGYGEGGNVKVRYVYIVSKQTHFVGLHSINDDGGADNSQKEDELKKQLDHLRGELDAVRGEVRAMHGAAGAKSEVLTAKVKFGKEHNQQEAIKEPLAPPDHGTDQRMAQRLLDEVRDMILPVKQRMEQRLATVEEDNEELGGVLERFLDNIRENSEEQHQAFKEVMEEIHTIKLRPGEGPGREDESTEKANHLSGLVETQEAKGPRKP